MESLKRQARQAKRYRNLSAEIRKADAAVLHVRWSVAKNAVTNAETELTAASSSVAACSEKQAQAAKEQAVAAHEFTGLRNAEAKAAAGLQRLRLALGELDAEDKRVRDRIADLERRLSQFAEDAAREKSMISETREALARFAEELGRLDAEDAGAENKAQECARVLTTAEERLSRSEQSLSVTTSEAANINARRGQLERSLRDAATRIDRLGGQVQEIDREAERIAAELAAESQVDGAKAELEAAAETLRHAEEAVGLGESKAESARDAERAARGPVIEAEKELGRIDAEAAALTKLLDRGASDAWAPVVESVRVESGYEKALGAALGEDLDAPVEADAPAHWSRLEGEGDPPLPDGVKPLSDVVDVPAVLSRRIAQIGLAESTGVEPLRRLLKPGQRLVSVDGDMWRWDGFTAAADAPTAAALRLEQKNRLEELTSARRDAVRLLEDCRKQLDTLETTRQSADDAVKTCREDARSARQQVDRSRDALAKAERQVTERVTRQGALAEARIRLVSSLEEAEAAKTEANTALSTLPEPGGFEESLAKLRAEVAEHRAAVAEARANANGLAREAEMRRERRSAIGREQQSWKTRSVNADQQMKVLAERQGDTADELNAIRQAPDEIMAKRRAVMLEIDGAEEKRKSAADALALGERRQMAADQEARETLTALTQARESRVRAEERVNAAKDRRLDAETRIAEVLECKAEEAAEIAEIEPGAILPDIESVERRLDRLKVERERLGAVNLRAEDEAVSIAEQRDALILERDDLVEAIKKLRQGILSLNREARERLLAAFDTVNGHFKDLFTHLFGGGTAELQLVDSDDPLDAGLEIIARPPGKKPQTMTLLSGGEQALTALALIFAVFLTNPAPICVLDEVDAPLDDANVERYCDLLDEMSRRTDTRFVIVTHNPITMARMNRLFGVTMAERGVSQLVSVDLETAESFREAG